MNRHPILHPWRYLIVFFAAFSLIHSADAQQQPLTYYHISGGTGFIINRSGDVITNAHVLQRCQAIYIGTDRGMLPAQLLASDTPHDLAVLQVPNGQTDHIAPLRWNISDLKIGDPVIVMGYPGQAGANGQYVFRKSTVTALSGINGEPHQLQLASITEFGNSGGPVLDTAGNVIAVISSKAFILPVDAQGHVGTVSVAQSDIAITLASLQDFLRLNHIAFYESATGTTAYSDAALEAHAHAFIVPVWCVLGLVQK